jgi:hypothetical protein
LPRNARAANYRQVNGKRASSGEIAPVEGEQGKRRRKNGDYKENADMARRETLAQRVARRVVVEERDPL